MSTILLSVDSKVSNDTAELRAPVVPIRYQTDTEIT
jgi:hypothetical protein